MDERYWLPLLALALMCSWPVSTAYDQFCHLPSPTPGGRHLPVVSRQFTVHVEATFLHQNSTTHFIEFYDFHYNRGKLRQTKGGTITDYYYDYGTNELLVIKPDTYECSVQPLSTAGYSFVLGDNNGHIFSPAAALRFAGQAGSEVYTGKGTVRGINVNQWTSCLNWPKSNTTMEVVWSFVDNLDWVASASTVKTPVQCHVTGRVYSDDKTYRSFEHLYEFVHYIDNIPPDSEHLFETPPGVVCPGRKSTTPLPSLPDAFAYTGESVNEERKSLTYTQEKYDAVGKIVSYKFRGFTSFSFRFGTNPLAVVNDFNTGTEYALDLVRGNCTVSPLTMTADVTQGADLVTLRMKSAAHMLNLDGNYTYLGKRTIRGAPCNVWITEKHAKDFVGVPVNATFEWAFSTSNWTYQNDPGLPRQVPVQVIYTLNDFGSRQQAVTNVYDYEPSFPDIFDGINLNGCFIGLPRNYVVFSISRGAASEQMIPLTSTTRAATQFAPPYFCRIGQFVCVYKTLLQFFQTQFQYAVRHSIAQAINISPLRVANVQYRVQQLSLDVSFDLLSVPDAHSRVLDPRKEQSLENATQDLQDAVRGNRLVVQMKTGSDQPSFIVADPASLRVLRLNQARVVTGRGQVTPTPAVPTPGAVSPHGSRTPAPPTTGSVPTPSPDHQTLCQHAHTTATRYSAGVMAGSAVSMSLVGGVLGGLTHKLIARLVS